MPKVCLDMPYTRLQHEVIDRCAEIEQEDADVCAHCGGEDCICCEIYHDRMNWKSPEELFADDDYANIVYEPIDYEEDEDAK